MRLDKAVALTLCLLASAAGAEVQFCDVQSAVDSQSTSLAGRRMLHLKLQAENLNELKAFMDRRDWEDGKPLAEQMDAQEAAEFSRIGQETNSHNLTAMVLSKRERDIESIGRMADLSYQFANGFIKDLNELSERDKALVRVQSLMAQEIGIVEGDAMQLPGPDCSLENALRSEAQDAMIRANAVPQIQEALAEVQRLKRQYPSLTPEIMGQQDFAYYTQHLRPVLDKAKRQYQLAYALLRLSHLEATSLLMHQSNIEDMSMAAGDVRVLGVTWDNWFKTGKVTEQHQRYSQIINTLNQLVPSEFMRSMEE